jgi:gluconolactonase
MTGEVLVPGLMVPEGPAMLADGRVIFTEQTRGAVCVFDGARSDVVAITGGSPNSAVLGADGTIYVCQNGGTVGTWRSPDRRRPGIQQILGDGTVRTVAQSVDAIPLVTPNDLAFGPDGRLYFTDPAQPFDLSAKRDTGKIFSLDDSGGQVVAHAGAVYCNGIGFGVGGELIWVESYTRRVVGFDVVEGRQRVVATLPAGHVPDGLAVAADGRIFIASCGSHGIDVLGPDGSHEDFLLLDDHAFPSNLCFDGSALWVTDFRTDYERVPDAGRLWRVETDALGAPVHVGTVPTPRQSATDPVPPTN